MRRTLQPSTVTFASVVSFTGAVAATMASSLVRTFLFSAEPINDGHWEEGRVQAADVVWTRDYHREGQGRDGLRPGEDHHGDHHGDLLRHHVSQDLGHRR